MTIEGLDDDEYRLVVCDYVLPMWSIEEDEVERVALALHDGDWRIEKVAKRSMTIAKGRP